MRRPTIAGRGARKLPPLILLLALLQGAARAEAGNASLHLQSGPKQVALLELYTSQGCSSCPPADRWLSRLEAQPGLWTEVVPIAFHVDYWDDIGWRDPFAQHRFSERQRRYAHEGGVGTVYTPGVLLNGREWRTWRVTDRPRPPQPEVGRLALDRRDDGFEIRYRPLGPGGDGLRVTLVLLGFDLLSEVDAGENRGRDLLNDFTVLALRQSELRIVAGGQPQIEYSAVLPAFDEPAGVPRLAVAAWVSPADSQAPLQAVGGWLD